MLAAPNNLLLRLLAQLIKYLIRVFPFAYYPVYHPDNEIIKI